MDNRSAIAALLDPTRLAVAGALVGVDRTVDELVGHTGRSRRDVIEAVAALRQAGVATAGDGGYTVDPAVLHRLGREITPARAPMDPRIGFGMTDEERAVLARFFRGARLSAIPTGRTSRLVVLQRLAIEFEPGRRYDEREVNETLAVFHADTAALRRYLVDEEFLDRGDGWYWRSGGRVDIG